ncbi:MAG: sigma-54-dependent transcriptional regulator [Rhodospirillales bacterium]
MSETRTVLLVEDDPSIAHVYMAYLKDAGVEAAHVENGEAALAALADAPPDVMLLDLNLPDMDGFDILRHIGAAEMPVGVVVITGQGSMNTAIEAMKLGARDFLVKPFDKNRLLTTIENAMETQTLRRIVQTYRDEIDKSAFGGFIGSSAPMQAVYRTIESAAHSKASVFITGESGTGKEVCAQAIHDYSGRNGKSFTALNCGAIPKDLVESEIFGHVKGAFTGASSDRMGAAGQAKGGTLFLDEICEMELSLQPKLLRFLQTGTFQRVGSEKSETADVRIICATNRDPWTEVNEGRFREDLYYRLHVLPVHLPPLRERGGDSVEIARHFLKIYAREEGKKLETFAPESEAVIAQYPWPGNVRQLQNVLRNIAVLHDGDIVTPDMLPAPLDAQADSGRAAPSPAPGVSALTQASAPAAPGLSAAAAPADMGGADAIRPLAELEKEAVQNAIRLCGGNIPEAALKLGISAATIYRKKAAWRD